MEEHMTITRRSILSGDLNQMTLPVTNEHIARWQGGEFIQDVMPHLSPDEREFLINGSTPEEWERYGLNDAEE
ncbi:MAG: hypothetical protein LC650_03910 [Actinobacteria bacterium]|nr:hypothetical protein [Actinomycetota bacterium]